MAYTFYIFQTINKVKSNNQKLEYHRFTSSGCKDLGIRKLEIVAKTQLSFLLNSL